MRAITYICISLHINVFRSDIRSVADGYIEVNDRDGRGGRFNANEPLVSDVQFHLVFVIDDGVLQHHIRSVVVEVEDGLVQWES